MSIAISPEEGSFGEVAETLPLGIYFCSSDDWTMYESISGTTH